MTSSPTPLTPGQFRILAGFAGFLFLSGAALTTFGAFFLKSAQVSRGWPSVPGVVNGIEASRYYSGRTGSTNTRTRTYVYQISYQYVVDGQPYTGDRYSLGEGSTASRQYDTAAAARQAGTAAHPPGSPITVYYDPEFPGSAVLKPGANVGSYVPLILGLLCFPAGAMFGLILTRAPQPS